MSFLTVVPIYVGDLGDLLRVLVPRLEEAFRCPVEIRNPWFDPEVPFDPGRGQYNSTLFLAELLRGAPAGAKRILGVTGVDLFVPVLSYVFGEAQLDGRAAVVSIHRLRNELYGLPRDNERLAARLVKEAIHELGHTFGLVHCVDPTCVMHASTYVEEIDLKAARFCPTCTEGIRGVRGCREG